MAYIKSIIAQACEVIKRIDMTDDEVTVETSMKFIDVVAETVPDPRVKGRCKYNLHQMLVCAFLAILAGYNNVSEFAYYCKKRHDFLKKLGLMGECTPSHDFFRRMFTLIDPECLLSAVVLMLTQFCDIIEKHVDCDGYYHQIAIDGKEITGSGRKKDTAKPCKNTNIMNFYDVSNGIVIKCESISAKENEIPVSQQLMKTLRLKQTIVSCDAMNSQVNLAEIITKKKGDYVFTIKDNQATLHDEMKRQIAKAINTPKTNPITVTSKDGKVTKKYYRVPSITDWAGAKSYVLYRKETTQKSGKVKIDDIYFLSSLKQLDIIVEAIQKRWSVENDLHRYKDLLLNEDKLRYTNRNLSNTLAILNNFALALIKLAKPVLDAPSYKITRKDFCLDGEKLALKMLKLIGSKKIIMEAIKKVKKPIEV